jgi:hypothetical protein
MQRSRTTSANEFDEKDYPWPTLRHCRDTDKERTQRPMASAISSKPSRFIFL